VVNWSVVYAKQALKDAKKVKAGGLKEKAPFEKLVGDLSGAYSRRINIQHRLVYEVFAEQRTVRVLRMWTHYD